MADIAGDGRKSLSDRERLVQVARVAGMTDAAIARAMGVGRTNLPPRDRPEPAPRPAIGPTSTMENIAAAFCEALTALDWPVTLDAMRMPGKRAFIATPRMVAMWLIRSIRGEESSLLEIAEFFGKKDHSTAIHAIKNGGPEEMARHPVLAKAAEQVRARFIGDLIT